MMEDVSFRGRILRLLCDGVISTIPVPQFQFVFLTKNGTVSRD